jgi:hypothetical protein
MGAGWQQHLKEHSEKQYVNPHHRSNEHIEVQYLLKEINGMTHDVNEMRQLRDKHNETNAKKIGNRRCLVTS